MSVCRRRTQFRLPAPACPVHRVAMRSGSTTAAFRYWYCPVPGCRKSHKQVRSAERAVLESLKVHAEAYP